MKAIVDNLPKIYKDTGFKGLIINDHNEFFVKLCKEYFKYETQKNSLVMCGNVGAGKTHLAIATLRNMFPIKKKQGISHSNLGEIKYREFTEPARSIFLVADEFFQELNDAVFKKSSKQSIINKYLQGYDVVCLDDLGVKNFSEAKRENLYLFVNQAYLDNKRIIITTNCMMEDLKNIDERISDRLKQMAHIIWFQGKSFRK